MFEYQNNAQRDSSAKWKGSKTEPWHANRHFWNSHIWSQHGFGPNIAGLLLSEPIQLENSPKAYPSMSECLAAFYLFIFFAGTCFRSYSFNLNLLHFFPFYSFTFKKKRDSAPKIHFLIHINHSGVSGRKRISPIKSCCSPRLQC